MKTHGSSVSPLLPITEIVSSGAQAQIQFLLTLNPLGWTTVQIHLWVMGQLLAWHRRPFSVQSQPRPSSSPLLTFQGSDPLNLWLFLKCFVLSTIEWTTCTIRSSAWGRRSTYFSSLHLFLRESYLYGPCVFYLQFFFPFYAKHVQKYFSKVAWNISSWLPSYGKS